MHSSTFSSDSEHTQVPWLKTWLLAGVVALTLVLGWEIVLRRLGYRPSVVDDQALWASQRERVYSDCCEESIVLLGDCRMQLGFTPQALMERFPRHRAVQLAVQETSPVAVLRDLAADRDFQGVVICALNERLLCRDMWETQQPYVDYYRREYGLNDRLNTSLATAVQRTLACVHPRLRFNDLAAHLVTKGRLPAPYYLETLPDRSRLADYACVDLEAHRTWAVGRVKWLYTKDDGVPLPQQWLEEAMQVELYVRAIQARGGRVIFARFPTSGEHLELDDLMFPKNEYWDAFAAETSALCIHFKDVPELSAFDCPDTSHLDRRDAPRFTLAFANVMEDKGVLPAPPCTGHDGPAVAAGGDCRCRSGWKHLIAWARCACCRASARRTPDRTGHDVHS